MKSQLDKIDELERDHLKLTATQTLAEVKKYIYKYFPFDRREGQIEYCASIICCDLAPVKCVQNCVFVMCKSLKLNSLSKNDI